MAKKISCKCKTGLIAVMLLVLTACSSNDAANSNSISKTVVSKQKNPATKLFDNDRILFDFDKSESRPEASEVLDTLANALKDVHATSVEIRGHTDARGSDDYNQTLSEKRARSVLAGLQQRSAAQSATSTGYGESLPVAPNEFNSQDDPSGRQRNRRVEIFVRT